ASGLGLAPRPCRAPRAGCCPATPCRPVPTPARAQRPAADSSTLFERLAGRELLAPAVVQIAEAERFAARQLQAGQPQRALAAGDIQAIPVGREDLPGRALPCAKRGGMDFHHHTIEAGMADRPG